MSKFDLIHFEMDLPEYMIAEMIILLRNQIIQDELIIETHRAKGWEDITISHAIDRCSAAYASLTFFELAMAELA